VPGPELTGLRLATEVAATDPTEVQPEGLGELPAGSLRIDGSGFALGIGRLPQGRSRVAVWVRDRAGNVATKKLTVVVDSSEELGEATLVRGARGADVVALQERLKTARVYRGKPTGVFDAKTYKALRKYQRKRKIAPTGVAGPRTLRAMIGRIVINLGQFKLRLIREGRVVKTYEIAIGQSAYPTPTGRYAVIEKKKDPAWFPPNSPWAKGLGPIPPGPGNPLGTRWIGTSAPAIGMHGTYADYSVGTAASHGCLRMHIPDVEELYEQVSVGMPVIIRA